MAIKDIPPAGLVLPIVGSRSGALRDISHRESRIQRTYIVVSSRRRLRQYGSRCAGVGRKKRIVRSRGARARPYPLPNFFAAFMLPDIRPR